MTFAEDKAIEANSAGLQEVKATSPPSDTSSEVLPPYRKRSRRKEILFVFIAVVLGAGLIAVLVYFSAKNAFEAGDAEAVVGTTEYPSTTEDYAYEYSNGQEGDMSFMLRLAEPPTRSIGTNITDTNAQEAPVKQARVLGGPSPLTDNVTKTQFDQPNNHGELRKLMPPTNVLDDRLKEETKNNDSIGPQQTETSTTTQSIVIPGTTVTVGSVEHEKSGDEDGLAGGGDFSPQARAGPFKTARSFDNGQMGAVGGITTTAGQSSTVGGTITTAGGIQNMADVPAARGVRRLRMSQGNDTGDVIRVEPTPTNAPTEEGVAAGTVAAAPSTRQTTKKAPETTTPKPGEESD